MLGTQSDPLITQFVKGPAVFFSQSERQAIFIIVGDSIDVSSATVIYGETGVSPPHVFATSPVNASFHLYETERECTIQSRLEPIRMSMATPSVGQEAMSDKAADFSARAAKSWMSEFEGKR